MIRSDKMTIKTQEVLTLKYKRLEQAYGGAKRNVFLPVNRKLETPRWPAARVPFTGAVC